MMATQGLHASGLPFSEPKPFLDTSPALPFLASSNPTLMVSSDSPASVAEDVKPCTPPTVETMLSEPGKPKPFNPPTVETAALEPVKLLGSPPAEDVKASPPELQDMETNSPGDTPFAADTPMEQMSTPLDPNNFTPPNRNPADSTWEEGPTLESMPQAGNDAKPAADVTYTGHDDIDTSAAPSDVPPQRKPSLIPEHLAALHDPPKSSGSKPLTPLQELLAVVNSTVEHDSLGGAVSEPEFHPPPESEPSQRPQNGIARLKAGVEEFRKLGPGGLANGLGGKQKKAKKTGVGAGFKKTKTGGLKGTLKKSRSVPLGGFQPALDEGPKTPLRKETSAELKKRGSQVEAILGREETPEEKRSHKKKIPLINIGERILIYWPMDGVFYSGKVVEHVVAKHRYTVLYDDNEMEVLDLSKEIWRPGTLDPKKERMPGEGILPPELGLPSEGDIPHYMPPRKRRRFEKLRGGSKWGAIRKGGASEHLMKKKKRKLNLGSEGLGAQGLGDQGLGNPAQMGHEQGGLGEDGSDGGASIQEMGAIEALLGVAGNKFGGSTFGGSANGGGNSPSGNGLLRRDSEERGPIFIGLKKKRSKQGEGKLLRLAATLDRTANGGYVSGPSNGWTSPKGGSPIGLRFLSDDPPETGVSSQPWNRNNVGSAEVPAKARGGKKRTAGGAGTFTPGGVPTQKRGANALNGVPAVPLPPEVQQILTDFEKRTMEKEEQKAKGVAGVGKRQGKRKRKFTPKPKGAFTSKPKGAAKGSSLVRKRSFGETQFVELACGGALLVSSGELVQPATKSEGPGGELKLENGGGMGTVQPMAGGGSRLMRSAAVVAQKRIEATAGGTIALAEVEAYRRGGFDLPRKRTKREPAVPAGLTTPSGSVPASIPDPSLQSPKTELPSVGEAQKPASRRLWWLDTFGGQKSQLSQPPADPPKTEAKPEGVNINCEGVGETKVGPEGGVNGTGVDACGAPQGLGVLGPRGAVCVKNENDVIDAKGVNSPVETPRSVNAPQSGTDSEHSPKDEVVNTGEGVVTGTGVNTASGVNTGTGVNGFRGLPDDGGANRASVTGRSEMDGVNAASDTDGVNGHRGGGAAQGDYENGDKGDDVAGVNNRGGVHGPETSRVESDSTAALQPNLENGSSGQMGGAWLKIAAKTLADVGGVAKWLEALGMGRLACLFAEHEVVDDALPHLTSDDLKEMGVKAVGTRRLILNNIELLKQGVIGEPQESGSQ